MRLRLGGVITSSTTTVAQVVVLLVFRDGMGITFKLSRISSRGNAPEVERYWRPRLANEIFQDRPMYAETIERFRECLPIVPRLRSLNGECAEEALV